MSPLGNLILRLFRDHFGRQVCRNNMGVATPGKPICGETYVANISLVNFLFLKERCISELIYSQNEQATDDRHAKRGK